MDHKTYKCSFCDFTYVWINTPENTQLANDHSNTHPDKPVIWSWVEVPETKPLHADVTEPLMDETVIDGVPPP